MKLSRKSRRLELAGGVGFTHTNVRPQEHQLLSWVLMGEENRAAVSW